MFKTKYRIVEFEEGWYRIEMKLWWFPFWLLENPISRCHSVEPLEYRIKQLEFKPRVIKEL